MAGMSVTPKREEAVLFSIPYGTTGQTFATLKSGPVGKLPDDTWVLRPQEEESCFSPDSDTWLTDSAIEAEKPPA